MRCKILNFISTYLGSSLPICQRVSITPSCIKAMSFSELIPEISSNNSWIIPISNSKSFSILEEHVLRKLSAPPKSISILIRTAPLRSTSMIVQNNHKSYLSKNLNCNIKYLHSCFTNHLWICTQILCRNGSILKKHLK